MIGGLTCLLLLVAAIVPAAALNQRIYPLKELIKDADSIAIGRAVAVDVPKMRAALVVDKPLKGTVPYRWMAVNVAPGGWGHPPAMIRRLGPGVPVILFAAKVKSRHVVLGYQNGTWFQMTAPDGKEPDRLPWTFTHVEVYLRRTFSGGTPELEQVLRDVLAGKREAPAPNLALGAGMGPEVPRDYRPHTPLPPLPAFVAAALAAPKAGGNARMIPVRKLSPSEQQWVDERSSQFQRLPEETAMLLAQAEYLMADAQRALELERDYGRGGNRAWVRSAEEILELKQRSDRLSWLDVRGVLMRAGELFTPVGDPVEMIHDLRTRFTWDELDPVFDDDKWGRKKLAEAIAAKVAARSPHPLGPADKARDLLYEIEFGAAGTGELPMEATGWKALPGRDWDLARRQFDWSGGESGSQRPGAVRFHSNGSRLNPLPNMPPKPGIPLAAGEGEYRGASLWFAGGAGDYEGRPRNSTGAYAYFNREWVQVRQGDTRSFLIVAQVYTPDHTDAVGEPRSGWFYIRRPSRYIDAGIRIVDAETRTVSMTQEEALLLKVEPSLAQFDRVLLRVDVSLGKQEGKRNVECRNEIKLIAYADGIGEVARAVVDLNRARRGDSAALDTSDEGVALAPAFGVRSSAEGYVPEFYLAALRFQQINEGSVTVVRGDEPPRPRTVKKAAASPAPPTPNTVKLIKGPRKVVIAIDASSSMAPLMQKARAAALEVLGSLKPVEQFMILTCARDVVSYSPGWVNATPENVQKASAWVRGVRARAGTNIAALLQRVLAPPEVNYVALVTDGGEPSIGERDVDELLALARQKNIPGARIDALLVAPAPADNIASRLALASGGQTRPR